MAGADGSRAPVRTRRGWHLGLAQAAALWVQHFDPGCHTDFWQPDVVVCALARNHTMSRVRNCVFE